MALTNAPTDFQQLLDRDGLLADLGNEMRDVLAKLAELGEHGKAKGSLTLTLDFAVEDGVLSTVPDIKVKKPKERRRSITFFVTPEGGISTSHPRQRDMFNGD
ncbi:MAG: hypothetical protein P4L82_12070 [Ancalomicrobiaceae bacterium]|nr:hypothetical protein [Ancalomicrobiaceae bacterium]